MGVEIPKYTPPAPIVASKGLIVESKTLGLPERMDLASLMLWLTTKMRDSDANIRSKMAGANDRKAIQEALNDVTIALRESRTGEKAGAGHVAVKPPLDNLDAIRASDWYMALDTTTRDQIDGILSCVKPPGYWCAVECTINGASYKAGDLMTLEDYESAIAADKARGDGKTSAYPLPARISTDDIDRAVQSVGDISKNLSSNDEIQMIELQSIISARGQLLQMVSNMIASFNETAKSIAGNMRG